MRSYIPKCCLSNVSIEFPVEYKCIDFKWLMIGEKLKHMNDKYPDHKPLFDDDYFSEMIINQEENLEFFGNTVIQNIIDY